MSAEEKEISEKLHLQITPVFTVTIVDNSVKLPRMEDQRQMRVSVCMYVCVCVCVCLLWKKEEKLQK